MLRQSRKLEHIKYALMLPDDTGAAGFGDVILVHRSLPELRYEDVDCSCIFLGKRLEAPFLINAITGGHPDVLPINRSLARVAARAKVAMAVGSQRAALEDPAVRETYTVAREENPDGVLLANLSATCTPDEALEAVEMVAADGLQLFLNAPQELAMTEGEVDFRGILDNIAEIVAALPVPVVVKEVGFGMTREIVEALWKKGVSMVDIGGRGGTDFIAIERLRRGEEGVVSGNWGIPTAVSLFEVLSLDLPVAVIASGGLRTALDLAKSLAAGAVLGGMARPLLQWLVHGSEQVLLNGVEDIITGLRKVMFMVGARDVGEMRQVPLVVVGRTAEWLIRRGVEIDHYARRRYGRT